MRNQTGAASSQFRHGTIVQKTKKKYSEPVPIGQKRKLQFDEQKIDAICTQTI